VSASFSPAHQNAEQRRGYLGGSWLSYARADVVYGWERNVFCLGHDRSLKLSFQMMRRLNLVATIPMHKLVLASVTRATQYSVSAGGPLRIPVVLLAPTGSQRAFLFGRLARSIIHTREYRMPQQLPDDKSHNRVDNARVKLLQYKPWIVILLLCRQNIW
jgi:hypothetical protein